MDAAEFDVGRLKARDGAEWRRLQEAYARRIWFYLKRMVGSADEAEDLCSETFLGALRGIERFDERFNVEQYLFGIARNKAIDHLRRRRGGPQMEAGEGEGAGFFAAVPSHLPGPTARAEGVEKILRQRDALTAVLREFAADLWRAGDLRRLAAVEMTFLLNWKHRRIAERLGMSDEKAVAGIKFRAIREIQERLRRRDPGRSLFSGLWESR